MLIKKILVLPYKMKIWHRILVWWFGELRKFVKLKTTKFSFLLFNACKNTIAFTNIKSANHSNKIDLPNQIATKYSSYTVYLAIILDSNLLMSKV